MSLPSLGVNGARPLLESPVELAGLSRRANGLTGMPGTGDELMDGIIVVLLGRAPDALPGWSAIDDRFESCAVFEGKSCPDWLEIPDARLIAGARRTGALGPVDRPRVSLVPTAEVLDDGGPRISDDDGIATVLLRCLVLLPLPLLLLARLPLDAVDEGATDVDPEPLVEVTPPLLAKGGRDVTLNDGVGVRCLIGIGAIGGSDAFGAKSWVPSLRLPRSFLRIFFPFKIPSLPLNSSFPFASCRSTFSHSSVIGLLVELLPFTSLSPLFEDTSSSLSSSSSELS